MRQCTVSALVQFLACRLFDTKPLPEPMLAYCQFDSWEHISAKFESEFYHFHSSKFNWKCRLPKWRLFCTEEIWVKDRVSMGVQSWNELQWLFLKIGQRDIVPVAAAKMTYPITWSSSAETGENDFMLMRFTQAGRWPRRAPANPSLQ